MDNMTDGIELQFNAVNRKLKLCGQPEIGMTQFLIIVGMSNLNIEAINRISENMEHIINNFILNENREHIKTGMRGYEND